MVFPLRSFSHDTQLHRCVASSDRTQGNRLLSVEGVCALLLASAFMVLPAQSSGHRAESVALNKPALSAYGKLPLSFELNQGQTDSPVKFIAHGPGYTLFIADAAAVFSLQQRELAHEVPSSDGAGQNGDQELVDNILNRGPKRRQQDAVLRVQFVHANKNAAVTGLNELPGKTNYIRGHDPAKWTTNIPSYAKLRYSDVFQGIDLVYYGNQRQLEYDFVVSSGADPREINLKFSGARGLRIDQQTGDLVMHVGREEVHFHKPIAYQDEPADSTPPGAGNEGRKHLIAAEYHLDSHNHVSFALGPYDRGHRLVIDPTLSYSTYIGGSSNDYANAIAVDSAGNAYVTGYTNSVNFPVTPGAYQTTCRGGCSGTSVDAFVTKLDPTGSFLVYSTYLGGAGNDYGNGIALDASGDAYIAGQTFSTDFPTTLGAFKTKCGTDKCLSGYAFVTELNSTGSGLVYSTYLGGVGKNQGNTVALDASDNAYITGYTQSLTFPTTPGAFQTTCKCAQTVAFVSKLNATGSGLIYSTYLGGSNGDVGYGIAVDSSNNAYLTGYTQSFDFPTSPGAFQASLGANRAAWVTKLNSTGSALVYSTYLGGVTSVTTPCEACGTAIAVDSSGNAYVCGLTAESNFPVSPGAYQMTFMGPTNGHDAFLTMLNPTGSALVFSTYLGGNGDTGATGIALDQSGNIWLKGNTKSNVFPVTPGAFQSVLGGAFDAYVSELDPTGSRLLYSTYLGGTGTEYGGATGALALDTQNPPGVYVTGYTNSTNFPVVAGSLQTQLAGENDGFVTKFAPSPNMGLPASLNFGNQNDGTSSAPQTITVTNTGNETLTVTTVNITGANSGDFSETNTCTTAGIAPQSTCTITVTFTPTITGNETASVSITDNAPASPQSISFTGFGIGTGPAVQLSATSLTFPLTLVGAQSKVQTVTLTNSGNATLTITQIAPSGDFTETNTCGTSVAVGASCTITIKFKPTMPNTRTGAVTITDNAAGSPQSIALTGTGTVVTLSPSNMNFGAVTVGQSSNPKVATFKNTSTSALAVSIAITGAYPLDFSEANTCGSSVPAGSSCTISVTFTPAAKGMVSASVSVTDAGGGSPQTVTLVGAGQ